MKLTDGRTHKAKIESVPGGVARNMAEALAKLSHPPLFISKIGNDVFGQTLLENCKGVQINTKGISISNTHPTAIYSAVLNHEGECIFGMGDMNIHSEILPDDVEGHTESIRQASMVIIDGNIPVETISKALRICAENSIPVWFEPTEVRKAKKLLELFENCTSSQYLNSVKYISPNIRELIAISGMEDNNSTLDIVNDVSTTQRNILDGKNYADSTHVHLSSVISQCFTRFSGLEIILLTRGKQGIFLIQREGDGYIASHLPPPIIKLEELKSVSGAGDCFNAGFISGLLENKSLKNCVKRGTNCAKNSLQCSLNVPNAFN